MRREVRHAQHNACTPRCRRGAGSSVFSTSVAAVPLLSACRGTPTTPPPGPEAAHSPPSPRWPLTLNTAAGGQTVGYDNIAAASYGLPAGLQACGDALVFMTDAALQHLDRSEGFEIGVGPSIVVVDDGVAKTLTTTTAREDVSAFIFGQEGLMAGLGLQGSKITRMAR